MERTRRTGLGLAAAAAALWGFFVVALVTGDPADGATIGAGLAALLAFGLSVAALVVLLASLRSAGPAVRPRGRDARVGAPLAVVSLVLFAVVWVAGAGLADEGAGAAVLAALGAGIVTFLAATACFLPPRRN
ncbi:hypothetical protein E9529_16765 [Blastococcus sp. KM273128]|uniref:hypothetical protein n=1 Tax=Blastococcus sp. KM273128 TaxID=2570314 RepID=UPI001F1F1648|nr:hypothetical protein [Blastococcus sp. KM273128]MCF6745899.1 hypothetical protein [Blastococcus sp. KM273128]